MEQKRKTRQTLTGHVSSASMKTISVQTYRSMRDKKYGKYIRKQSVFKAHDEEGKARVGDKVRIFETRPISKTKRWRLAEILEKRDSK